MRGSRLTAAEPRPEVAAAAAIETAPRHARLARIGVMMAADLLALVTAGTIAYAAWARAVRNQPAGMYVELLPLLALFVIGYARTGLYPGFGLGPVETLRRLSYVTGFGFLIVATFSFALKLPHLYSRVTFAIAFGLSLVLVPLGRLALFYAARGWRWWREPVAIVGTGPRAVRAAQSIRQSVYLGYRPVAVLTAGESLAGASVEGIAVLGDLDRAREVAAAGVRVAFLEIDQKQTRSALDGLQQHFQHVILLREFDDLPVEGVQIRNLGQLVGVEYTNNLLLGTNRALKRAMDIVVACAALVLVWPAIAAAAVLVRLLDGGPVFFHQVRTGLGGRPIRVPKIRTMRLDAEERLRDHLASNVRLQEEWAARQKLRDDPRLIPAVGRLFRRFSVDELPQFWSVLIGDMSLVGPRPFPDYHLARFPGAFLELRQRVRPGITGLWQITVRSDGNTDDQQAFDTYYIRNWSLWFDLYILARTVAAVLSGRGAY